MILISLTRTREQYSEYHRKRKLSCGEQFKRPLITFVLFLQYINETGVRVCLKELYDTKYDPLSISYTVLSGTDKIIHREFYYFLDQWFSSFGIHVLVTFVSYAV